MAPLRKLLVDVHTHVYLPRYASLLRSRSEVPRIFTRNTPSGQTEERLLVLDNEPSSGRPVGSQYWDKDEKLKFMDQHGIDISFVSSANPWLDFLPFSEAQKLGQQLNADLESYCATSPALASDAGLKRLYGFGLLPIVEGAPPEALPEAVSQLATQHPHIRGIILGTHGIGLGLDDPNLEPLWAALAETGLVVFLHPRNGLGEETWGPRDNGHVLPLALGFPLETTIAITRLILAGVLDRHPKLRMLIAHSGGALPQLSSRLASCIDHDPVVAGRLAHDARWYLGRLWYDAVAYGAAELEFVSEAVGRAGRYARDGTAGTGGKKEGASRLMFGTDHPFFPPLKESGTWRSVVENLEAIEEVGTWTEEDKAGVRGWNALKLFRLSGNDD